jgi:hypothetical protein
VRFFTSRALKLTEFHSTSSKFSNPDIELGISAFTKWRAKVVFPPGNEIPGGELSGRTNV